MNIYIYILADNLANSNLSLVDNYDIFKGLIEDVKK